MKVKQKSLIFFLVVLIGLVLISVPSIPTDKEQESLDLGYNLKIRVISPQTSQLTELPYVIRIDNNWTETVTAYDWCTGSGTESDPYIIQGINISIPDQEAHIAIKNSVEHFIIRSCSFSNIEHNMYTVSIHHFSYFAGIFMEKAEYGLIENCTFTNIYIGVSMRSAENVVITNCRMIGSPTDNKTGFGGSILIEKAENVNITNNYFINFYHGLQIRDSENCIVDHNHIENLLAGVADADGIYFAEVNNSAITNNDFYGCIAITQQSDVIISGLSIAGLGNNSINIDSSCHNIRVFGNRFYDMNGNLLGGSTSILAYDKPIILGTIVSITIIGIMRKKKNN